MAKKRDDEWRDEPREVPAAESSFADVPPSDSSLPTEPPPVPGQEQGARPASGAARQPGEEPERFPASRGVPPRPHHDTERPAMGAETGGPYYGSTRPIDPDNPGAVPRVCHELERAVPGSGLARWKIRAEIPGEPRADVYILAREDDEEGAKRHYAEHTGLTKRRRVVDDHGEIKEVMTPYDLIIRKLPD